MHSLILSLIFASGVHYPCRHCVLCTGDLLWTLLKAPIEIAVGVLYGCIGGTLLWVLPVDRKVRFHFLNRVPTMQSHVLRFVLLFGLALLCMFGSTRLSIAGAGALGTLIVPLVASIKWQQWSQTGIQKRRETSICADLCRTLVSRVWEFPMSPMMFGLMGNDLDIINQVLSHKHTATHLLPHRYRSQVSVNPFWSY